MKLKLTWVCFLVTLHIAVAQTEYPTLSTMFLDDYLAPIAISDNAVVTKIEGINSKAQDYAPVPFEEGIVFTSTRGLEAKKGMFSSFGRKQYSDLFYAKRMEGNTFGEAQPLMGEVNGKFHDSAPTFNSEQTMMIFTRTSEKGKNWKGRRDLQLYQALATEGGSWSSIEALPHNSKNYTSCHPTLSANGELLIFASNRPGGYGGMDLWAMKKKEDSWEEPVNLGPSVNSQGNEVFPHITQEGELYFSSDGHFGAGGLDIFLAIQTSKMRLNAWALSRNLGAPFNSKKDDFGFTIGENKMEGYLSSNRKGGTGKDDIYTWKMDPTKIASQKPNFTIFDESTETAVAQADVMLVELPKQSAVPTRRSVASFSLSPDESALLDLVGDTYTYATDDAGQFNHFLRENKNYVLIVKKRGYLQHMRYLNLREARRASNVSLTPVLGGGKVDRSKDMGSIEISPETIEALSDHIPTQIKTFSEESVSRASQPAPELLNPAVGPLLPKPTSKTNDQ